MRTELSEKTKQAIDKWLTKFPPDKKLSGVLYALHVVQEENGGYLTESLMEAVAAYLEIPNMAVFEVATFYSMYDLEPVGKHKINVCTNISCMLSGSKEIMDHLQNKLNVKPGETTADGKYILREVECLAACKNAPMMQIDKLYYENLTPEKVDEILDKM